MIIDAHAHLTAISGSPEERVDYLLRFADRMNISRICLSLGPRLNQQPTSEQIQADNEFLMQAIEHRPERVIGFCYVSPAHPETSLAEMERWVVAGPMRGLKAWVCRRCTDAGMAPIAQRAGELGVPLLQHTWRKTTGNYPGESSPTDLAQLAAQHPQTQFIMAHSGGDWEWGIRAVRHVPNVVVDLCGSDPEYGQVQMAVRVLGYERVVWGSDAAGRSFASQLAKVYGADLPTEAREAILGLNIARMIDLD